jgi:hypothetical protein
MVGNKADHMTNYKELVMQVNAIPRRTTEILGVFTISVALTIPSIGSASRTKLVTLATWRGVSKDSCYWLRDKFFQANDEYAFKEGVVTAKWQVTEYL